MKRTAFFLRFLAGLVLMAALAFWGLLHSMAYLLTHEAEIRMEQGSLQIQMQDRDRPAGLPFQRQSQALLWENIPNYVLPESNPPVQLTNSLGCQAPEPVTQKTRPRILCLGDSSTFGLGVAYSQTYSARLEQMLGEQVEVHNCGVVGYTSAQGLRLLQRLGPVLQPDIVVAAFGYNERWLHRTGDLVALAAREESAASSLLHHSQAYLLLRHLVLRLLPAPKGATEGRHRPRLTPAEFEEQLGALLQYTRQLGAQPVVITLAENPLMTGPIKKAQAFLDENKPLEAAQALQKLMRRKWHRYPLVDELCARIVKALPPESVPPQIVERAKQASIKNWGRIFNEEVYLAIAARLAQDHKAPYISFPPAPRGKFYADDIHPSAQGHEILADAVAKIAKIP